MRPKSGIDQFLQESKRGGQQDSRGAFTLAQSEALRKLAKFQLPFEGAWSVKIVQAAVAAGRSTTINVTQTRRQTSFAFRGAESWTPELLQDTLLDPDSTDDSALNHLKSALWEVGFHGRRSFQLRFQDGRMLEWDGHGFQISQSSEKTDGLEISVSHWSVEEHVGLLGLRGWIRAGKRNAAVAKALGERCYVCPIPLVLDGRSLCSWLSCPSHSQNSTTQPLAVLLSDHKGLPPLSRAAGSFRDLKLASRSRHIRGQIDEPRELLSSLNQGGESSLTVLVAMHMDRLGTRWTPLTSRSVCHWVSDGAVVEIERYIYSHCSVALFVSAAGLNTDLSGFQLRDSLEKHRRSALAVRAAQKQLAKLREVYFENPPRVVHLWPLCPWDMIAVLSEQEFIAAQTRSPFSYVELGVRALSGGRGTSEELEFASGVLASLQLELEDALAAWAKSSRKMSRLNKARGKKKRKRKR